MCQPQKLQEIDGYLLDDHGEIVGFTGRVPLQVDNDMAAEWVMEKLTEEDAQIQALETRKEVLIRHLDDMQRFHHQRVKYWLWRYEKQLQEFARANLPKGRKTWICPYGSIAFRQSQGSVKILDMEKAVAFARQAGLGDKVRTREDVLVSDLKPLVMDLGETQETYEVFAIEPPSEKVTIATGIKKKGEES